MLCYVLLIFTDFYYVMFSSHEALRVRMLLRMGTPEAAAPISGLQVNVRAANWDGNVRLMLCYVMLFSCPFVGRVFHK